MSNALLKDINLNKTRNDATFSLKAVGGKNIKHETILYNINKIINNSDISLIDYTKGGVQSNKPLEPLNTVFSDNIVVYSPINDELIKDIEKLKEDKIKDDAIEDDTEEEEIENTSTPKSLNKIAKDLLAATTATIKRVFNELDINVSKSDIKPVAIKRTNTCNYKPSTFAQLLKVNLSKCDVDKVFSLLEDNKKLEFMHKNNIFIHDIDFTRDYKGVFNKENVIKYLVNEHDFVEEGDSNPDNKPTIINNSRLVSNNCLTFIRTIPIGTIRYKFYNKFVQSMESPSVRNKIGSHINEWCNNPEPILNKAIENSLDSGLLRLEFTCYVYNTNEQIHKESIIEQMEYLQNLMAPHLIYYNKIQKQFNLLCENILYNIVLVDLSKDLAFVALYHNKLTGKVNGFYLEDVNSTKLSNAIRWYCSNKPIVVVLVQFDDDNEEINIQQDTYLRVGVKETQLYTYICKGCEKLKAIAKEHQKDPQQTGLIANNTFNFVYASTNPSLLKSSSNANIVFSTFDMDLLKYPNENNTIRIVNKEIKESLDEENFKQVFNNKIKQIKTQNEEIEKQMLESVRKEMIRNKLYKTLSNVRAYTYKFIDLEDNTTIYVYSVKEITTRYGKTYLLVCSLDNCIEETTELKLYWSPLNITHYIDSVINNGNFKQLDINNIIAYGSLTGIPRLTLIKDGTFTNESKHLCAKVKIVNCKSNGGEDIKEDDDLLKIIDANIKQCHKIDEDVKIGDTIKIIGYKQLKCSLLIRCIINDSEEAKDYIATYWLKQIILNKLANKTTTNHIIAIAGTVKTTPQKSKAMLFSV